MAFRPFATDICVRIDMTRHRNRSGLRHGRYCAAVLLPLAIPVQAIGAEATRPEAVPDLEIPTISVIAPRFPFLPDVAGRPLEMTPRPAADGGDFLRSVPGVSGSRMGGHGIDPVIRGMQGNQINVTADNIYIHGGCPNRMDPPSSFSSPEIFDLVTVSQGYRTVTRGPGGPGGHVAFERTAPLFGEGEWAKGSAGGGIDSNGGSADTFADIAVGQRGFYLRATGTAKEGGNYEDGGGNEIRSSFSQRAVGATAGYQAADGTELTVSAGFAATKDALFEGAQMDAPEDEARTLRAAIAVPVQESILREVRADTFFSGVDHVMDNYSLRTRTAPMAMRVDSDSDTVGGSLAADLDLLGARLTLGFDLQRNRRQALRFAGMTEANVTTLNALMWPGTEIRNIGLFAETEESLTDDLRLRLGARYDRVDVSLGKANQTVPTSGRSPNDLYLQYYGTDGGDRTENNFSGLVFLEYDLTASAMLTAGISRSVRTADATERSMASDRGAASWVGNPGIAPEAHHQAEIGARLSGENWSADATAYADWVQDFILRDTARGQDGILMANGASIYRNVDAFLSGLTLSGRYRLAGAWLAEANATYTFGENLSDGGPLAQIPPLEGSLSLTYERERWSVGGTVNAALRQTRVDDDAGTGSGLDVQKTPGWVTVDLHASMDLAGPFKLRGGVTNLFDREYAYHLNRANAFDPASIQVNEPGRSVYLRVSASF